MSQMKHDHLLFCKEYLLSGSATEAYRIVYGTADKGRAATLASRLMKRSDVKEHIRAEQEKLRNKGLWEVEDMIQRLKTIADSSIRETTQISAIQTAARILGIGTGSKAKEQATNVDTISDENLDKLLESSNYLTLLKPTPITVKQKPIAEEEKPKNSTYVNDTGIKEDEAI